MYISLFPSVPETYVCLCPAFSLWNVSKSIVWNCVHWLTYQFLWIATWTYFKLSPHWVWLWVYKRLYSAHSPGSSLSPDWWSMFKAIASKEPSDKHKQLWGVLLSPDIHIHTKTSFQGLCFQLPLFGSADFCFSEGAENHWRRNLNWREYLDF